MSPARLQSGAIRSFIRGGVQPPLPSVPEPIGLTSTSSAELPPAGTPALPPRVSQPHHATSDAQVCAVPEANGASDRATAGSSGTSSCHSHSQESGSSSRESGPQLQGMHSPIEVSEDSTSQLSHCESQARALSEANASDGPSSSALTEQQVHWPAEHLGGQDKPHMLRFLTTQVDRQLAAADEWGFDTIELGEVAMQCSPSLY